MYRKSRFRFTITRVDIFIPGFIYLKAEGHVTFIVCHGNIIVGQVRFVAVRPILVGGTHAHAPAMARNLQRQDGEGRRRFLLVAAAAVIRVRR